MNRSLISKATILGISGLLCLSLFSCKASKKPVVKSVENGVPIVERYGQLRVEGANLCNEKGEPVQLRGMSSFGLQWAGKYVNKDVMQWVRDDWNATLWRSAMYLTSGGYIGNKGQKRIVYSSIEDAKALGIYVIADWHVLGDKDPLLYEEQAIEFFDELSKLYGDCPNLIYEICNEPNGEDVTWEGNIKPYAEKIIEVIRKNDPDNIIIVGSPNWSGDLFPALKSPITGQKNIMYTFHFYAGSHAKKISMVRHCVKHGMPVFITEWGTTKDSGDGGVFEKETLKWMDLCEQYNISWANWSINSKGEDSGILQYNADKDAKGGWTEKELSKSGIFVRKILRGEVEE